MFGVAFMRPRACAAHVSGRLVSLAGLVLSGCAAAAVGAGDHTLPRSEPAPFAPSSPTAPSLESPLESPIAGPTLDRAAFVRAVLERNPSIESARQGWRAARARVPQAGALDDPMLELGIAPLSIGSSQASLGYEVAVSQRLPWFGKRSLDAAVAAAEAEAIQHDYEATRRDLALTALTLYGQYFLVVRSLEINRSHLELMRALRDTVTAQFGSGHASAQDSLRAEAELTHLEHDAVTLASERDVTAAQMNELLHRAPELPLPPPPAVLPRPAPLQAPLARLEDEARAARPDLEAARSRVRREQARAERAARESFPDLTLSASYDSMWDMPQHRWMVGLGLNLPIQTARRANAVEEAQALRAQFESDALRLSDAARTQVFIGAARVAESEHVVALFETRFLPIAQQQIDAAQAGFVTSQVPLTAVIEAERNLRSVELEAQRARVDDLQRGAELERALGRIPGLRVAASEDR